MFVVHWSDSVGWFFIEFCFMLMDCVVCFSIHKCPHEIYWGPEPWQGWGPMVDLKIVPLQYYHWVPMVMALLALFWSVKHPTGRLANIHNESTILSHVGFMWLALILESSILNHNVYFLYCYVSAVDLGEWLCLFRACTRLMDTGPLSQAPWGQHVASPFGCAGF